MEHKAKKVLTVYGKHSNSVEYEYRGRRYYVEYANDWTYCVTDPRIQHQNAQAAIDEEIEREKNQIGGKEFDLDEIFKLLDW